VAFAVLAFVPLTLVAILTARIAVTKLRESTALSMRHDLDTIEEQLRSALRLVEWELRVAAEQMSPSESWNDEDLSVLRAIAGRQPGLFRLRMFDGDGSRIREWPVPDPTGPSVSGMFYLVSAADIPFGETAAQPVQVMWGPPGQRAEAITAIAVWTPLRSASRTLSGVLVAEFHPDSMFKDVEWTPPELPGVTVLAADSLSLYHSELKPNWETLFAVFRREGAGDNGIVVPGLSANQYLIESRPISFGSALPLTLYRGVEFAMINAPVHDFTRGVLIVGILVVTGVFGSAAIASRQFTQPIYQLRAAISALARGQAVPLLRIETNDEFEDLAADLTVTANDLATYRRRLEELVDERTQALAQTNAELRDVMTYAADAIIGLDADGRIRVWNHGAEALFGYEESEVLDADASELLHPPGLERELRYIADRIRADGAVVNLRTRRLAKGGREIPVSLTQTAIRGGDGTRFGYSLIVRDASVDARVEDVMRRSERLAAVSVMAAGLAHELNNPLAIIANRLDLIDAELDEDADPETLRNDLRVVQDHTSRLGRLTHDLLRFAREKPEAESEVDVEAVVRRVAGLLEQTLVGRDIALDISGCRPTPHALGDESGIETVCMNLILNAGDAMPDGGTVWVESWHDEDTGEVLLSVRDEGPGIPVEQRERVFEPFYSTKGPRGTGLGLTVCRTILERLGGRIDVVSQEGRGATFAVCLPFAMVGVA